MSAFLGINITTRIQLTGANIIISFYILKCFIRSKVTQYFSGTITEKVLYRNYSLSVNLIAFFSARCRLFIVSAR